MWKDLWFLVRTTLWTTFRKRSNLLIYFGLPIAGILISTVLYGQADARDLRVGIVNNDAQQNIAADTVSFLGGLDRITLKVLSEQELHDKLAAGDLDSGVILGAGYSESVRQGKPAQITIESVKGAQATAYIKAMLNGYVDNLTALGRISGGDGAKFQELYTGYQHSEFKVSPLQLKDDSRVNNMSYQSIGFLILFMLTSATNLSELILKNRENRTYFRVLSSPVESRTYVISNIVVNLCVMLAQIVVALFVMREIFGVAPAEISMGAMLGIMAIFALVSVSLSLVIVSFSKSTASAGALQNLIVTPTCLLSGCFFPIEVMPDSIRRIADFLPQKWVLQSITKLQAGGSFADIGFNLALLVAFAVVFFLIATYKFGRNNDTRNFV
ncbi:ABC transporter permease [Paenibacillus sp. NFR01]|uniref:ABC transporter permease n=1 Tax=Paenibacillus sp. NFR01 TaxID=1566279 RepID=UPI0008BA7A47|nr:ABC transporter permease [Paenibacillus sp. NFR01]SES96475.1 ABC-2 type transport system permease protein [Paenibacillus sp. NFR01]